jgi:hypothetical protein
MVGLVVAPPCLGVVAGAFSTTVAGCPEDSRPMIPGLRVQRGARALVSRTRFALQAMLRLPEGPVQRPDRSWNGGRSVRRSVD